MLLVAVMTGARAEPAKVALLVGIDRYGASATPGVPAAQQWKALAGSGNDVDALAAELGRRGFDVRVLKNADATRQGIVDAFRAALIDKVVAGRGDLALFHFSGHGQQVPDDDADEADGYDETLVPYDNRGTADGAGNLRDDDLGSLLDELGQKTDRIVVTLDACHSGTGTRGSLTMRGGPPSGPPAETRGTGSDRASDFVRQGPAGYVVLTAARANELAAETTDPERQVAIGTFTYALVGALRGAGPETTWRQIMDRVGLRIATVNASQHPQIEGDRDKVIFSGRWALPARYFVVGPAQSGGRLTIEGGSLLGLAPGTELGLFPLDGAAGDPETAPVKAKIDSVQPASATARVTSGGSESFLTEGARAFEVVSPRTPRRLRVAVESGDKVKGTLAGAPFLALVQPTGESGSWDVRVVTSGRAVGLEAADGEPVLFPTGPEEAMVASVASDGKAGERVLQALELHWRRLRLVQLGNDDAGSNVGLKLALHRVDAAVEDGVPRVTRDRGALERDGGEVGSGDIVQMRVTNTSQDEVYVTILELATDGAVHVWYPDNVMTPSDTLLRPGETRAIMPPIIVSGPAGEALWKVIGTTTPVDLTSIALDVKGAKRATDHPVGLLLEEAASPTRARPFAVSKKERWGTDAVRIRLR